tara:strand:- start:243 stop:509 length:267 start_codon:yes stop_codon:yes gene_type:complete
MCSEEEGAGASRVKEENTVPSMPADAIIKKEEVVVPPMPSNARWSNVIVKEEHGIPPMPSDAVFKHEHVQERRPDDRPTKKRKNTSAP